MRTAELMSSAEMKTMVKHRAKSDARSHSLTEISVRDMMFAIDGPIERGATTKGATPTDTALEALAGCTNEIAHKCADKLGYNLGNLSISVTCDFDQLGVTLKEEVHTPFQRIKLDVVADGGITNGELRQVAIEVAKYCPLSKLFRRAGTTIGETWTSKNC